MADAYVNSDQTSSGNGTATSLWVDGSPIMRTYLKFPAPATKPSRAQLQVYATRSTQSFEVRAVPDASWTESSVSYLTAPAVGASGVASGPVAVGTWVSVDVTALLPASGDVSLALVATSSSSQAISSRESGATTAPRLVVDQASGTPAPTPTASSSPTPTASSSPTPTASSSPTPTPSTTPGTSTAPVYYVDAAAGDDANAGTAPATAWRTLAKVNAQALPAGSAVLLRRGASWSEALMPKGSGTASAPVTIAAYGDGAAPVVRDQSTCVSISASYVVVRDLEVRSCSWAGVEISGSFNRLESSYVTDTAAGVYIKRGAVGNHVVGNQLIDNNRMSVLTTTSTSDDSGAFGVLLHGDDNEIAYNTIKGSDAFSYDYGRDGAAIELYGGIGNRIHHNVAIDNDAFTELGNSRTADNAFAYNLVRSALETSTFLVTRGAQSSYGPVLGTAVHNNTVVMTGASSQGFVCHAGCDPTVLSLRNNVIQAAMKVGYADSAFDEGNNVYFGGARQFPVAATSTVADPGFVNAASGDFHLRAGSPAIDVGAELGYATDLDGSPVPLDGNADGQARPDAGAFELAP